jgi:hypothetical protein
MKNKTTTYILLAGVALIWGIVFYKIFSGIGADNNPTLTLPVKPAVVASDNTTEDSVLILWANYRDPFLGTTVQSVSNFQAAPQKATAPKTAIKKEATTPIDWGFINYIGIVMNKETNKKVGIIKISGKEYMVNDKDVIDGVTILKKERDSIKVEYKGNKAWIKR